MYRVLIAEDEVLIRTGIQASISWARLDMQVIAACCDGVSAWQVFEQEQPDVLITDIRMPAMDGITLIHRVRSCNRRCRIVIISCVEDFFVVKKILDQDVSAYLLKAAMSTEEMQSALSKVKAELDSINDTVSAMVSHFSAVTLLDQFLFRGELTSEEFSRKTSSLQTENGRYGALIVFHLSEGPSEQANNIIQDYMEQRLKLVDPCILLIKQHSAVILTRNAVSSVLMRSCSEEMIQYLSAQFGLSAHSAAYLNESSAAELIVHFSACRKVLMAPYFYPKSFYDLSGAESQRPEAECSIQAMLIAHPLSRGLSLINASRFSAALSSLEQAYGISKEEYIRLLCHLAELFSMHISFPANLKEEIASAPCAKEATQLLYNALPSYEQNSLYAHEIDQSVTYVCNHFCHQTIKLSDLAVQSNFSVGYFALLFRRRTGLSFTDYLSALRMEKVRCLLEDTQLSIRQISDQCGFTSVSYFTRYFSQKVGISPKEWRKRHCTI